MVNNHFPYFLFIMNVIVNFLINFHLFYMISYSPCWNGTAKALRVKIEPCLFLITKDRKCNPNRRWDGEDVEIVSEQQEWLPQFWWPGAPRSRKITLYFFSICALAFCTLKQTADTDSWWRRGRWGKAYFLPKGSCNHSSLEAPGQYIRMNSYETFFLDSFNIGYHRLYLHCPFPHLYPQHSLQVVWTYQMLIEC